MLEEKLNLLIAMAQEKPKKVIKEKFTKYVIKYSQIKNPMKNDITDYKNTFIKYLDYMQEKKGE